MSYSINLSTDPELAELLTRRQPVVVPSAPKCPKCNKSVYKAEEIRAANQIFHKLCFKCGLCNKLLEPNILTEHHGDLFCKSCYAKNFGPKGYGYGVGAGTLSMDGGNFTSLPVNGSNTNGTNGSLSNGNTNGHTNGHNRSSDENSIGESNYLSNVSSLTSSTSSTASSASLPYRTERKGSITNSTILGGTDRCGRCQKPVYMAEKVVAAGHAFHKLCFTCFTCKKLLNSMNCCDNSEGEIFCKACYGKQYGPKGIGYGIGAGTLKTT